jgi:hypothetical protein
MELNSWKTKEILDAEKKREKIVENRDINAMFNLTWDFNIALREILVNDCTESYNPSNLNQVKRTLFLCIMLEDSGQADSILTFLQEEYPMYKNEVIVALHEIGASKSAEIITKAIELLPKDETWFYDIADENMEKQMHNLDKAFSDYPDGPTDNLYRKYAEQHKNDLMS